MAIIYGLQLLTLYNEKRPELLGMCYFRHVHTYNNYVGIGNYFEKKLEEGMRSREEGRVVSAEEGGVGSGEGGRE